MYMIKEFRKFAGFRILEYFITHPTEEIHLKELSRKLEMSSGSVKIYCDTFEADEVLISRRKGNLRLFTLNNHNFAVREMKKAYYYQLLKELGVEELFEDCISMAIYGSFASGNFDERSDLDILVIGESEAVDSSITELERKIGREVQLTVIPYYKWEKMKKEGDEFAENVTGNHVLIKGAEI